MRCKILICKFVELSNCVGLFWFDGVFFFEECFFDDVIFLVMCGMWILVKLLFEYVFKVSLKFIFRIVLLIVFFLLLWCVLGGVVGVVRLFFDECDVLVDCLWFMFVGGIEYLINFLIYVFCCVVLLRFFCVSTFCRNVFRVLRKFLWCRKFVFNDFLD